MQRENLIVSKTLVIGQNPAVDLGRVGHLSPTMKNFLKWADILQLDFFSFCNAFRFEGKVNEKDIDIDYLKRVSISHRKIIALGEVASKSLNKVGVSHFKLPHPSPLNRKLNDKVFIQNILKECKKYLLS
jgi:hypothetical protein